MTTTEDVEGPVRHDCQLRLDHAESHIETLETLVTEFLRSDPWTTDVTEEEGGFYAVRLVGPPVPPRIALTAGDAINALRACLDNLAWQLVTAHNSQPHPRTGWPVIPSGDSVGDGIRSAKLGTLPDECKQLIRTMQPASGDGWRWVETLTRLWNDDKHRHLLLAAGFAFPPSGYVALSPGTSSPKYAAQHGRTLRVGRVDLGEVLFRLPPGFDDARLNVDVSVTFGEHAPEDETAHHFLRECLRKLRDDVLPAFRPFLPALGGPSTASSPTV